MGGGDRIVITVHASDDVPTTGAIFQWVVTRIVDALRTSPVPITVRINHDDEDP